ncbi:copper chaperone PCu(A)C [Streptomyces sp. NPDC050560]|uniref:copper chaperone PCu(A)C n=1 Tax=Streptomyces sp. NPDC050560 TaxID=3365630 RepID=UPI0037AABF22
MSARSALTRGVVAPVAVFAVAVLALLLYTATGAAGAPPARIEVTRARVLLPSNTQSTAALFDIRNTGESADTLLAVESPRLGTGMLAHTVVAEGAGHMRPVAGVRVPPGATVSLAPHGVDAMLPVPDRRLVPGEHVELTLRFAGSGTVRVRAVVVPPGD